MQVTVENTGTLGRRLKIQVPSQEMQTAVLDKMKEWTQQVRNKKLRVEGLGGFRPEKIPQNLLEQRLGPKARQEALGFLIEKTVPIALMQEKLKPAGSPVVESVKDEENQDLEFVINFEVFPEISLTDVHKIKVEKYSVEITEQDIDQAFERVRSHLADWVVVLRPAKEGDRVMVDYTSTLNGKPYENNQGKNVQIEIGSHRFIAGFEQGLIGSKQGDELELDLHFPPEWRMKKLAGKPVHFKINVRAITEKQMAEINAAFAKKIGASDASLPVIRSKIRESLEKQLEESIDTHLRSKVTDALIKLNTFPIPKVLIDREASLMHQELHQRLGDKTYSDTCQHTGLVEQAEKRVALGLILNEVIKNQGIKPDEAKVKNRVAKLSQMFGNAADMAALYQQSEELLTGVRHAVMLDQALDWVLSQLSLTEKKISVDGLLKKEIDQKGSD